MCPFRKVAVAGFPTFEFLEAKHATANVVLLNFIATTMDKMNERSRELVNFADVVFFRDGFGMKGRGEHHVTPVGMDTERALHFTEMLRAFEAFEKESVLKGKELPQRVFVICAKRPAGSWPGCPSTDFIFTDDKVSPIQALHDLRALILQPVPSS